MDNTNCTICDTPLIDQYCYHCGQRYYGKRLNTITIFSDLLANIYTLERSVFATLIFLIRKPYNVINNYWSGFRNYYQSPGKLLFYASTVLGLHIAFMGNQIMGVKFSAQISYKPADISQSILFLFLFIPMITFTSYISFIRAKRNLAEHVITVIYMISCWSIIMIILDDSIRLIFGNVMRFYSIFVFLVLIFIWNAMVFSKNKKWYIVIINSLKQIIVLIMLLVGIIFIIYLINPENVRI